jgi:ribonuclease HI
MRVFIDGGARGNPGPAGYGVRVEDDTGRLVAEFFEPLGSTTNNVAEYRALLAALDWLLDHGCRDADVFSDSELLVRQMHGQYRVRHPSLKPLAQAARARAAKFARLAIHHVPREANQAADRLANLGMDEAVRRTRGERAASAAKSRRA